MDDESAVREVLGATLHALGYGVALARDGGEAVALFQARHAEGRPFDLVMLDLTVRGGMGGAAALSRLEEIDSEVRAVAMSGYSNSPILANHEAHGFIARLEKPFLVDELKALLVDVMPSTRASQSTIAADPRT
jgi:DNA-binding NtrC family response regulator